MDNRLNAVLARYPGAETYTPGDNAALCQTLLELMRSGKKQAACVSDLEIEAGAVPLEIGRCDIALNWDGTPALVTRTLELRAVRFCDVTEEMALMEGEDETLADWQAGHQRYYQRNGVFAPDMPLTWERFEVVEDLSNVQ